MIFLETTHKIILEALQRQYGVIEGKKDSVDIKSGDFDGSQYRVSTVDKGAALNVSVNVGRDIYDALKKHGMDAHLKEVFGDVYQSTPEDGFDVTLKLDMNKESDKKLALEKVPLIKKYILMGPLVDAMNAFEAGGNVDFMRIPYRSGESMYVLKDSGNLIVIFSIQFKDPDDIVFAKTFLNEFASERKKAQFAPAVSFSHKNPPRELEGKKDCEYASNDIGFVSFVLFKNHTDKAKRDKTLDLIIGFRSYLHYHLKCSKAYMHIRMRTRVADLLQALNRSKVPEVAPREKKTISGRTFQRQH